MARLYLQAGCLLALLAACALAADVGKTAAGAQQYDGHYREEYDGPERDYDGHYHHKDEHYFQKTEAKTFYLQESSYDEFTGTSKFRCAKERDAADVCLHPAHYGEHRQYDSDDFLSDLAFANDAAICSVTELAGGCPSIVPLEANCRALQLNCTVGKAAKDCGCPYEEGFAFTSTGYAIEVNATSCEESYDIPYARVGANRGLLAANYADHNVTLFNGVAVIVTTHIDYVQTGYGYKEIKGKVEFVANFNSNPAHGEIKRMFGAKPGAKAGTKPGAKPGAKAGTKAGTAYEHYEEEDSHYEAPYYGHEDRYYEAAHHDHHHGRDSYDSYPKNLVKGGNLKITLLEKQYY